MVANRDTEGATFQPTVAAINLRVLVTALQRLQFSPDSLLAVAGLRAADLNDPDALLPVKAYLTIISHVQQSRPELRNLALHVAAATSLGAYDVLDYLVAYSDNVGHGFRQLARHFAIVGAPVSLEIDESEPTVRVLVRSPFHPFGAEYAIALHFFHSKREADGAFTVSEIAFQHHLDDLAEWQRACACPVIAGASWTGMALSRRVWELPFRRRDPVLRKILERDVAAVEAQLPMPDDVAAAVRQTLVHRLERGESRIDEVAKHLGTAPRTLQRRLASKGLTYQQILEDVRRVSAQQHLADRRLSISDVAFLLGYGDRPTFHRAFRRWTGMTPQAYRAQQMDPESE